MGHEPRNSPAGCFEFRFFIKLLVETRYGLENRLLCSLMWLFGRRISFSSQMYLFIGLLTAWRLASSKVNDTVREKVGHRSQDGQLNASYSLIFKIATTVIFYWSFIPVLVHYRGNGAVQGCEYQKEISFRAILKWISLGIPCFPFLIDSFLSSSG